jgi:hypothetical protein
MKDLTGRNLETGDLILDIRTNWAWHTLGIVHGGATKGGQVRFLSINDGFKSYSKPKCLVKITRDEFEEIFTNLTTNHQFNKHFLERLRAGYEKIIEILILWK